MSERLYRTVDDRMLLGVLGGISMRIGIDPSIVRVAYAIVTVLSGIFPLIIAYVIMAIVIPEAPRGYEAALRAGAVPPGGGVPPATGPAGWPAATPAAGWSGGPATAADAAAADAAAVGAAAAGVAPAGAAPAAMAAAPETGSGSAWGAAWDEAARNDQPADARRHGEDARVGAVVGGLVLVGLGSLFLLVQLAPGIDWAIAGPVALVVLGVVVILGSFRRA